MLKDGMTIEATHVKKKQLHHYLSPELVQKKKKVKQSILVFIVKIRDVERMSNFRIFRPWGKTHVVRVDLSFFYCMVIEIAHMALGY